MKKNFFFGYLYLAEGAPIGFIWWALPAILAERGLPLTEITQLTALATLPWTFKFLMAPLVDMAVMKGLKLRWQLAASQFLMGGTALILVPFLQQEKYALLGAVLLAHSLTASFQDVCIDALAIRNLSEREMGTANGFMQAGMLLGRSLFGGAGIFLVHRFGVSQTIYHLVAVIWISLLVLYASGWEAHPVPFLKVSTYLRDLKKLIFSRKIWLGVLLAFLSGFAFEGLAGVASPTLVRLGMGADLRSAVFGLLAPGMMAIGALIGGRLADRRKKTAVLRAAIIVTGISCCFVAYGFDFVLNPAYWVISLSVFYFSIGWMTAVLYAFLMSETLKEFAAFQFSFFMAATNLCETVATITMGNLIPFWGYFASSLIFVIAAGVSIVILPRILTERIIAAFISEDFVLCVKL